MGRDVGGAVERRKERKGGRGEALGDGDVHGDGKVNGDGRTSSRGWRCKGRAEGDARKLQAGTVPEGHERCRARLGTPAPRGAASGVSRGGFADPVRGA